MDSTQGSEHEPVSRLKGLRVAFTGRFASMTHEELGHLIGELGGQVDRTPSRRTDLLVIGDDQLPLDERARPTQALERARQLQAAGYALEIIGEREFWGRCGIEESEGHVKRRYTIGQLGQLLGVKRDQIRTWMRAGLIAPVEVQHRLPFFDFRQVQSAKLLCELAKSGVVPSRIRASLEQLRRWIPGFEAELAQLAVLEERGQLLLRYDGERLAEPSGQLRLSFEEEEEDPQRLAWEDRRTADELFEEAVEMEDIGRLQEAATAYGRALELEPDDPILHFNKANAEYGLHRLEDALYHFRRATELDPQYAEAWNNLGCVYCEQGHHEQAIAAFTAALQLVPTYGDAVFNLADALSEAGRHSEAREHWRLYLKLDAEGPWADAARERLAANTKQHATC